MTTLAYSTNLTSHTDPVSAVIFWGTLLLFFGVMGRYIAKRFNQPGVLGELFMGIFLGNLCYFLGLPLAYILRDSANVFHIVQLMLSGWSVNNAVHAVITNSHQALNMLMILTAPNGTDWIKIAYVIDTFSRYGVIFLLFMVGLDSSVAELKNTGRESVQVALIGVAAPIVLGLALLYFFMPEVSFKSSLFVAATLSATSVGITARVLKDMQKLRTREAKTILGAAMLDDILGLIILAIVSGIVITGVVNLEMVGRTLLFAVLFFVVALACGPWILRKIIAWFNFLDPWEAKLLTAFLFMMCCAWLATVVQLAAIIGAFVAGIILHDGFFESRERALKNPLSIRHLMAPLESIFAPLFFILIGIEVKIETFTDWHVLLIAAGLVLVAILGKLLSGLGGAKKDDRWLIGIGMLPRGEVGLIFASIGKALGVMSEQIFAAIVVMVIVTTVITPILLKQRYKGSNETMLK